MKQLLRNRYYFTPFIVEYHKKIEPHTDWLASTDSDINNILNL